MYSKGVSAYQVKFFKVLYSKTLQQAEIKIYNCGGMCYCTGKPIAKLAGTQWPSK